MRNELRRTFDERLAPLAREQCMIDEKMKFENHEFYVVKYDAVNFPSVAQHVDEKHVTFWCRSTTSPVAGGGNQFQEWDSPYRTVDRTRFTHTTSRRNRSEA